MQILNNKASVTEQEKFISWKRVRGCFNCSVTSASSTYFHYIIMHVQTQYLLSSWSIDFVLKLYEKRFYYFMLRKSKLTLKTKNNEICFSNLTGKYIRLKEHEDKWHIFSLISYDTYFSGSSIIQLLKFDFTFYNHKAEELLNQTSGTFLVL